MKQRVIDASVLVKLGFAEPGSDEARQAIERLCRDRVPLHVPDHAFAEIVSAARRKIDRGEGSSRDAREFLAIVLGLQLVPWSCVRTAGAALEISLALGVSPYDAFYLAVAEHVDGRLVTADHGLASALAGTVFEGRVEVLGRR